MDKTQLLDKVNTITKDNFDKTKLIAWVQCLEGSANQNKKPSTFKKGDVLMHPIFAHPYVLLEKKPEYWMCGLLTSEANCSEIIDKCESRFFEDNHFTRIMFTYAEPQGKFIAVYENTKQLNQITKKLKELFGK
jgi:hypothetical protein